MHNPEKDLNTIDNIWELEGYLLAQHIYESKETI